jgi:hypothetical protein
VVLVGVARERASAWKATKQVRGQSVDFTSRRTGVDVDHYYVYLIDREWGPAFLTIGGYAPYALKACPNGHEWAKRQGPGGASPAPRWTTAAWPARTRRLCRRSATP